MKGKIFEAGELPSKEKVYLKKTSNTWRVVHPIKNEDGSWNWKNLISGGNWKNLITIGFIVIILVLAIKEYVTNIQTLLSCFENYNSLESCKNAFGYYENAQNIIKPFVP